MYTLQKLSGALEDAQDSASHADMHLLSGLQVPFALIPFVRFLVVLLCSDRPLLLSDPAALSLT